MNPSEISKETTPPKNFLKLVESNKQNKPSNSSSLLSTEDQQLADRLEKLKNQNKRNLISIITTQYILKFLSRNIFFHLNSRYYSY